jgi:hypothetical protein
MFWKVFLMSLALESEDSVKHMVLPRLCVLGVPPIHWGSVQNNRQKAGKEDFASLIVTSHIIFSSLGLGFASSSALVLRALDLNQKIPPLPRSPARRTEGFSVPPVE